LPAQRDRSLVEIERQIRSAIADALHRRSRRPFHWGGLTGYRQLEAIGAALHRLPPEACSATTEMDYLRGLTPQLDRALQQNRALAADVQAAHEWLLRLPACLHYPPAPQATRPSSQEVRHDVEELLSRFQVGPFQPAQTALRNAWQRLWPKWAPDLLHCYDIAGLPADNLQLECFLGCLRSHQRRCSGQQSTHPLRYLGAYQALFVAESAEDLLQQMRHVSLPTYQVHRRRLADNEAPRRHLWRLHRDPAQAIGQLLDQHTARCATLAVAKSSLPP
jgi:hypothetical protein